MPASDSLFHPRAGIGGHRIAHLCRLLDRQGLTGSVQNLSKRAIPNHSAAPAGVFTHSNHILRCGAKPLQQRTSPIYEGWSRLPSHHGFTVRYGSLFCLRPTRFRITPNTLPLLAIPLEWGNSQEQDFHLQASVPASRTQREAVTGLFIHAKLQFQSALDAVFPAYADVFGTLFSRVALKTLAAFPTAAEVLAAADTAIAETIRGACPSRSPEWADTKAKQLRAAAQRNPMQTADLPHQAFSLRLYIRMIEEYKAHLKSLDYEIDALTRDIEECRLIQSIPGIGATLAATVMAEIGEIARFEDPKKLVAFAGVDPSVHQSGDFTASVNRITKRGSHRLRHALYIAVLCSLRATGSKRMQAFYQAKRAAGKPYKVAVVACINKLLHWIYAVLTRREAFADVA